MVFLLVLFLLFKIRGDRTMTNPQPITANLFYNLQMGCNLTWTRMSYSCLQVYDDQHAQMSVQVRTSDDYDNFDDPDNNDDPSGKSL